MTVIVIIGRNMSAATLVVTNMRVKRLAGFCILSKIFKNKFGKFLTKFFFNLERNLGFEAKKNGLEMQKTRLYFSKT